MNSLAIMKDQQAVTSSLQVAEIFNKNHQHILEAIDNLTVENPTVKNLFVEGTYTNSRNRVYREIYMNRDGFTLLAMGFTGKKALHFKMQYINAFNQMEDQIKTSGFKIPSTMAEALRLAADQQEQKDKVAYRASIWR